MLDSHFLGYPVSKCCVSWSLPQNILESLIFLLFFFFKGRSSERDAIVPVHDKTTHEQGCNKLMSEEKKRKTDVKGKG